MKQLFKLMLALCMAAVMACAMIPAASAQEAEPTVTSVSIEDDGSKAYDLVWKYKIEGGHVYKRRWNRTLNCWYDPAWIFVQ